MIIKSGDFGNGVAIVQFALNNITSFVPKLKTDGVFGVNTEGRVRQHQSQKKNCRPTELSARLRLTAFST